METLSTSSCQHSQTFYLNTSMRMNASLLDFRRIWDRAPHNALTDLVRFRDSWFCVLREGAGHISPGGCLRILTSCDGTSWTSAGLLALPDADLRDPKITVAPGGRLMLNAAAAFHQPAARRHQSLVWFSGDGFIWDGPVEIGDPDIWLWRATWHKGYAYATGYSTLAMTGIRFYRSCDGVRYERLRDNIFQEGFPNEATLLFLEDDRALCLLRRDEGSTTAQLGEAAPPYLDWSWKDLGVRVGGPHMMKLPGDRIIAAVRRYGPGPSTSLNRLDPEGGRLTEFLRLPSGGDTSYAGLAWHGNILWVSYYSSHEERTCVYLARVSID